MMRPGILSGWWCLLGFWLLLAGTGVAHPILQNPMWVEVSPDVLQVKIYVSVRELNVVQGLPVAVDGTVDAALAVETAPRHTGYVLDHLSLRADGIPLSGKVTGIEPPREVGKGTEGPDRAHFIYRLEYPMAQPPAQIALSHTMVQEFPSAPGVPWDLSYTYRFGPPGATPLEFGSITRGVEVIYKTGFPQPAGTNPMVAALPPRWPLLAGVGLLGAALGLGVGHRREQPRLISVVLLSCLAGWGAGALFGWKIPAFAAAAMSGIGVLLISVDNIHRPLSPPEFRRWILTIFFAVVAGLALWTIGANPGTPDYGLLASCLGLMGGLALLASFIGIYSANRPLPEEAKARHPVIQLASLLICAGGLVILLDSLGLRPWLYWFNRLTS